MRADPQALGMEVAYLGTGYAVLQHGKPLPGRYGGRDSAEFRMHNVARRLVQAARPMRPCLCCATPFRSEGPHNRLCDPCRERA